jgi:hypothetical protein
MDAEDGVAMGFGDKRFPRGTSGIASKNGRVIGTSVTYCFKTGTRSSGPSSTIATVSEWLLRLSVTWPATRALRTQDTLPSGATSQRFVPASTRVTSVEHHVTVHRTRTVNRYVCRGPRPTRRRIRIRALRRRRQRPRRYIAAMIHPLLREVLRI